MTEYKITAADIEVALSNHFDTRRNFMIPNLKWGFRNLLYEIDLVVVTGSKYIYEIEIKISAGDLKRDRKKWKWGYCKTQHHFRKSYFAMPATMLKYQDLVPEHAGILAVSYNDKRFWFDVEEVRPPKTDALAKPITDAEYAQLGRLCMLRMWDMKRAAAQRRSLQLEGVGG